MLPTEHKKNWYLSDHKKDTKLMLPCVEQGEKNGSFYSRVVTDRKSVMTSVFIGDTLGMMNYGVGM